MITRISGVLNRVLEDEVRLQVGGLEYQVLVPDFVRRALQQAVGREVTLHTSHYFDGNPMQGRVVPRLIGFTHEAELEFFELFCTVDKVGTKKALKALTRPIKEIAEAIQRQDNKWLSTLPGVGAATSEQIVATLRRKVTRFAVMATPAPLVSKAPPAAPAGSVAGPSATPEAEAEPVPTTVIDGNVIEDTYQALMSVGHSPVEARNRLDRVLGSGKRFTSVEEMLLEVYKNQG